MHLGRRLVEQGFLGWAVRPSRFVGQTGSAACHITALTCGYVPCILGVGVDATVMNIALPSAQTELGFSNDSRQWIVTAYSLAFGSFLLLGGRLSDLFGRKLTFTGGLFCVVFGLSRAETRSWGSPAVWGFLTAGVVLLVLFVFIERKVAHPLLPMRVVQDRDRGGAYIAVFISGAGMFGIFLFLTYYMQTSLNFSPVMTGVAFLPMVAGIMVTAQVSTIVLLPRIGAKIPVTTGMVFAAVGLVWLTTIDVDSSYVSQVMPQLILCGLGMGLIIAPSMNVATAGVAELDAGVASAMVNTSQQVGGSIGTALLSTLATNAATDFVAGKQPTPQLLAEAAIKSYTTAFLWSAVIFAVGAVVCGLMLRQGKHEAGIDSPAMVA